MDITQHAHGFDDLGVSQRAAGVALCLDGRTIGLAEQRHGSFFSGPGNGHLHQGTGQRHETQPGADERHQDQEDERCRRVKHGRHGAGGNELTQSTQVGEGLRCATGHTTQIGREGGFKKAVPKGAINAFASTVEQACPKQVEQFHHGIGQQDHGKQPPQGAFASAVDDPVVNLQHEPCGHQHQQTGDHAVPHHTAKDGHLLAQGASDGQGLGGLHEGLWVLTRVGAARAGVARTGAMRPCVSCAGKGTGWPSMLM